MLQGIVLPFLVAVTPVEAPDDKPFYFRSFENASPTVGQYKLAGAFGPYKEPFALSLDFSEGKWLVEIREGDKPLRKLILNEAYNSIPVNRIVVATAGGERSLLVMIPFGPPHSECFLNGKDVYSAIVVEGTGRIGLEHFPRCSLETIDLPVKRVNGALEIGPPPKRR